VVLLKSILVSAGTGVATGGVWVVVAGEILKVLKGASVLTISVTFTGGTSLLIGLSASA